MGLKSFFRGVWDGIKRGATKVWGGLRKGAEFAGRIAKPIADVARGAGKILGVLPGKLGKFGRGLQAGGQVVRQLTDVLPDGSAKDKIREAIDRGLHTGGEFVDRAQRFSEKVRDTGQPILEKVPGIADRVGQFAQTFPKYSFK